MKSIQIVTWQIIAIIGILVTGPLAPSRWGSMVFLAFAAIIGVWAAYELWRKSRFSILPDVPERGSLVTTGPFRVVRHPIYCALVIGGLAYVLDGLNLIRVGFYILLLVMLLQKIEIEERQLKGKFPMYKDYARRTARLIPFIW